MEYQLLSKDYVLKNGVTYDDLFYNLYTEAFLDGDADDGGQPFTGMVYDIHDNGQLAYYCHYKDGYREGEDISFYENGAVKRYLMMANGSIRGEEKQWYPDGKKKRFAKYIYGICLSFKEWDENGKLSAEKIEPTENEKKSIQLSEKWEKERNQKNRKNKHCTRKEF